MYILSLIDRYLSRKLVWDQALWSSPVLLPRQTSSNVRELASASAPGNLHLRTARQHLVQSNNDNKPSSKNSQRSAVETDSPRTHRRTPPTWLRQQEYQSTRRGTTTRHESPNLCSAGREMSSRNQKSQYSTIFTEVCLPCSFQASGLHRFTVADWQIPHL
jgi:hypothetical protein